jgi:hypothetical protein
MSIEIYRQKLEHKYLHILTFLLYKNPFPNNVIMLKIVLN